MESDKFYIKVVHQAISYPSTPLLGSGVFSRSANVEANHWPIKMRGKIDADPTADMHN